MIRKILLAFVLLFSSQVALAQQEQSDKFQEGTHYFKLDQATPPSDDNSVEVTMVFSYLCSHCNALEPFIENWAQKKPANVKMNRIHVVFGRPHETMARGYITAEMTGIADESHGALMDAIWKQGKRFHNPEELADFYTDFGVDKNRFLANYNSFAADSQLRRTNRDVKLFGVTGTPSIVVNRKYRVPNIKAVMDVVDFLVAKESAAP
jgi:thiol:disulfide interchange protein DsbA